jgi:hypothetical protein
MEQKKGFFGKIIDKMDKKLEAKAKKKKCCCDCSDDEGSCK